MRLYKTDFQCLKGCDHEIKVSRKDHPHRLFGHVLASTRWVFSGSGRSPANRGVGKEVCVRSGRGNPEEGRASGPRIEDRRCGSRVEIQGTEPEHKDRKGK